MNKVWMLTLVVAILLVTECPSCSAEANADTPAEQGAFALCDIRAGLDAYMTAAKEQATAIRASLEQDLLTQTDMNMKSQELSALWDRTLNDLWEEVQCVTPEEEFEKLLIEQLTWMTEKEKAVQEAGKGFEGGSMYPLIVNSEAARLTKARAEALYELLKSSGIQ